MAIEDLYRPEAVKAKQTSWIGDVILVRPVSFAFLTAATILFGLVLVTFFIFGSYTKRSTVSGQLVPNTGLIKVYTYEPSVVLEKRVVEGQHVKRGDVLFVLSGERRSSTQGDTYAAISHQIEIRRQFLDAELSKTRQLQKDELVGMAKRIDSLNTEFSKIAAQIEGQKSRTKFADDAVSRSQELVSQNYISKEQLQQKQSDLLDQRGRLQVLDRDRSTVERELTTLKQDLSSLPAKHANQISQIERAISSVTQELSESEAKRRLIITASESGVATAVLADVGQVVDINQPLLSIVPSTATLIANLYVSSKAIGFIKPGDAVLMRYQAYPYQKFGHAIGSVSNVSRTVLPIKELIAVGYQGSQGSNEPLYQVTVKLDQQFINAYGIAQPLQSGMFLEADVMQETRKLYEWVLEPMYSITGKI